MDLSGYTCSAKKVMTQVAVDALRNLYGDVNKVDAYVGALVEQRKEGQELISPLTKTKMGKKIFPALQIRNHIATLIETGAIQGATADDWKERAKKKEDLEKKKKAREDLIARSEFHDPKTALMHALMRDLTSK